MVFQNLLCDFAINSTQIERSGSDVGSDFEKNGIAILEYLRSAINRIPTNLPTKILVVCSNLYHSRMDWTKSG